MANDGKETFLYMFGHSPRQSKQLDTVAALIKHQVDKARVQVVLINDGVIGVTKKGKVPGALAELLELGVRVHAVLPDMIARGIPADDVLEGIETVDYDALADLLAGEGRIVSWM